MISSHNYSLLFKAVLLDNENYFVAFSNWKQNIDFENDIDSDSIKLLPLLYQKLCDQKVSDELIPRLKGIYRKSWINNQIIHEQLISIIGDLAQQKITPLILPETASAFLIYKSLAQRHIEKFNFAIKQNQLKDAIKYFLASGWKVGQHRFDLNFIFKYGTNITFRKKNGCDVTLHWYPDFDSDTNKLETDLWDRSNAISQGGQELNFFSITDCFIYLVKNQFNNPLNLIDISTIITFHSDKLNWELILSETQNVTFAETLNHVLMYLKNTVEVIVPDTIYKVLSSKKRNWLDKVIENRIQNSTKKSNLKTKKEKIKYVYLQYNAITYQENWCLKQIGLLKYIYRNKKRMLELKK